MKIENYEDWWNELQKNATILYPQGPKEKAIWENAGGDVSTLTLNGHGKTDWHTALKTLKQGGGGKNISPKSLVEAMLEDFPKNSDVQTLKANIKVVETEPKNVGIRKIALIALILISVITMTFVYYYYQPHEPGIVHKWNELHDRQIIPLINEFEHILINPDSLQYYSGIQVKTKGILRELNRIQAEMNDENFPTAWLSIFELDVLIMFNILIIVTEGKEDKIEYAERAIEVGEWIYAQLKEIDSTYSETHDSKVIEFLDYLAEYEIVDDVNYQMLISLGTLYSYKYVQSETQNRKAEIKKIFDRINQNYKKRIIKVSQNPIIKKLKEDEIIKF